MKFCKDCKYHRYTIANMNSCIGLCKKDTTLCINYVNGFREVDRVVYCEAKNNDGECSDYEKYVQPNLFLRLFEDVFGRY